MRLPSDPHAPTSGFAHSHYPTEWIDVWPIANHDRLTLRPILPQDLQALGEMLAALSPAARQQRFHAGVRTLSRASLQSLTEIDFERHMAFVVTHRLNGKEEIVAEARYVRDASSQALNQQEAAAEFALSVSERWQHCGIGRRAMATLMKAAREQGLQWLHGNVLADNRPMLGLMQLCHFACTPNFEDERLVCVERCLQLDETPATVPWWRPRRPHAPRLQWGMA